MASRKAFGSERSPVVKSEKNGHRFDIDTDRILIQTKKALEAGKVLKKEQKNIIRKQKKSTSRELPKCIENFEINFSELEEAVTALGNLLGNRSAEKTKVQSYNVPKKTRERPPLNTDTFTEQHTQCMKCLHKDDKIQKLEETVKSHERNVNDLQEKLQTVQRSNNDLEQKLQTEVKNHKRTEENFQAERNDKENLKQRLKTIQRSNNDLEQKLQTEVKNHKRTEENFQAERNDKENLKQRLQTIQRSNNDLERKLQTEVKNHKGTEEDFQTERNERESLEKSLRQVERVYREERDAKEDALRRLSELASSRLRDNNPNIADLNDLNRPSKIAEMMSELYDKQWTEAYEMLETHHMEERDIIQKLLDILMAVYHECRRLAIENFFERVQKTIEFPVEVPERQTAAVEVILPDLLKQQVKEFRKSRAKTVMKDIELIVRKGCVTANLQPEGLEPYISCCIEISWLCAVQDPPLVLKAQAPAQFDTSAYKDYTRRGKYTEYVVWPALYLSAGGALLVKGVAQGCDGIQTSDI